MRHIKSSLEATVGDNQHLKPKGQTTNYLYTDDFFAEHVIKPNVDMLSQLDSEMQQLNKDRHLLGIDGDCPKFKTYIEWRSHMDDAVEKGLGLLEWAILSASRARRTPCNCHGVADFSVDLKIAKRLKKANTKVDIDEDNQLCTVTYYSTTILTVGPMAVVVDLTINTPSTRNRIDEFCDLMGLNLSVHNKDGKPYLRLLNRQDYSKCKSIPFPSHSIMTVTR